MLLPLLALLVFPDTTTCPTPPTPWPTKKWETAAPDRSGLDPARLDAAFRRADDVKEIRSLLVVRHGRIVAERYFHGGGRDEAGAVASITKSVVSLLAGIAFDRGLFRALDQRVIDFLPQWAAPEGDPANDMNLGELLTMTSGLADDWWRFLPTRLRTSSRPGTEFHYSNQGVQLVVRALHSAAKQPVPAFARTNLLAPMGLAVAADPERWPVVDKFGNADGAGGMRLTARELAKLGLLVLRKGCWDGRSLVPAEWIAAATRTQHEVQGRGTSYGYLFWITDISGHAAPYMAGAGGQFVVMVPDLDLVVVLTADRDADGDFGSHFRVIREDVVPAVRPD